MPICITMKHGEVIEHDSMIDALHDYMDSIDCIGLTMWWEPDLKAEYDDIMDELLVLNTKDIWTKHELIRNKELIARVEKIKEEMSWRPQTTIELTSTPTLKH